MTAGFPNRSSGFEYNQRLSTTQKFYGKLDYFPEWDEIGEYRLVADTGWEIELVQPSNLSLKISATDRYDSTPNGADPHLVNYSVLLLLEAVEVRVPRASRWGRRWHRPLPRMVGPRHLGWRNRIGSTTMVTLTILHRALMIARHLRQPVSLAAAPQLGELQATLEREIPHVYADGHPRPRRRGGRPRYADCRWTAIATTSKPPLPAASTPCARSPAGASVYLLLREAGRDRAASSSAAARSSIRSR